MLNTLCTKSTYVVFKVQNTQKLAMYKTNYHSWPVCRIPICPPWFESLPFSCLQLSCSQYYYHTYFLGVVTFIAFLHLFGECQVFLCRTSFGNTRQLLSVLFLGYLSLLDRQGWGNKHVKHERYCWGNQLSDFYLPESGKKGPCEDSAAGGSERRLLQRSTKGRWLAARRIKPLLAGSVQRHVQAIAFLHLFGECQVFLCRTSFGNTRQLLSVLFLGQISLQDRGVIGRVGETSI